MPRREVVVVSGVPRSGTSMMMAMLEAGGMELLIDAGRPADESNPNGYFEYSPVSATAESNEWVSTAAGKAVKAVYVHLRRLPKDYNYRVLFMRRDMNDIVDSQTRMLRSLGQPGASASPEQLAGIFEREIESIGDWISQQENFSVIDVHYGKVLANPLAESERIAAFLDRKLDVSAMADVVLPKVGPSR